MLTVYFSPCFKDNYMLIDHDYMLIDHEYIYVFYYTITTPIRLKYEWEDMLYLCMIQKAYSSRNLHLLDKYRRQFPGCKLKAEFAKVACKSLNNYVPSRNNGGIDVFWNQAKQGRLLQSYMGPCIARIGIDLFIANISKYYTNQWLLIWNRLFKNYISRGVSIIIISYIQYG